MPQVDHVPRRRAPRRQHRVDLLGDQRPRRRQQRRVEVALDRAGPRLRVGPGQRLNRFTQLDALVHADGISPHLPHEPQQPGGPGPEVDERRRLTGGGGDGLTGDIQRERRVGGHALAVGARGQRARPGVEELGCGRPGTHLGGDELAGQARAPGHEPVPGVGVGAHERARRQVVATGSALHQVGRQREGRPAEGEHRRPPRRPGAVLQPGARPLTEPLTRAGCLRTSQLDDDAPHRLLDRPDPLGAGAVTEAAGHQLIHLAAAAHRGVEDRPDTLLDPHPDARQAQRHHDVGEEDSGVDAVAPHRLQRHLRREPRVQAGLQHRDVGARPQCPGLRQRPSRLTHEPHGRACGSPARQRLQECRRRSRSRCGLGRPRRSGSSRRWPGRRPVGSSACPASVLLPLLRRPLGLN